MAYINGMEDERFLKPILKTGQEEEYVSVVVGSDGVISWMSANIDNIQSE